MDWYFSVLEGCTRFSGRARPREFWMFMLVNLILTAALILVDAMIGTPGIMAGCYSLAMVLPAAAVSVRRLHDTNHSGWWMLVVLIPIAGLSVLVLLTREGSPGYNRFGANPKSAQTGLSAIAA